MTPQNLFIETHNGTYLEERETQTGVPKLQVQSQAQETQETQDTQEKVVTSCIKAYNCKWIIMQI